MVGIALRVHQSGNIEWNGVITKRVSSVLRYAMVEVARSAVCWDERLGEFYRRVCVRRGGQKAFVVVANKLLKIVWVMLVRRETYGSMSSERYEEKLNRVGFSM